MLDPRIRERCRPIGLWGYGNRGNLYLEILIRQCGFTVDEVCVVERDEKRLHACRSRHPGIFATTNIDLVLRKKPPVVLVCVNTAEHLPVLQQTLPTGAAHFVEQPLVMMDQVADLEKLFATIPNHRPFAVGYPWNFSGAVSAILRMMRENHLFAQEVHGLCMKDRIGVSMPTAGVLEDQATHLLRTALTILEQNQRIAHLAVDAALSDVPYADGREEWCTYPSYGAHPFVPIATAHIALDITTERFSKALISLQSSYVAFSDEQRLDVVFTDPSGRPRCIARLEFDVGNEDRMLLMHIGESRVPRVWTFPANVKDLTQLEFFLSACADIDRDPQLVTAAQGILMVQLSTLAIESDRLGVRMRALGHPSR